MTLSPAALPHAATLTLTGWPRPDGRGLVVGGVLVRTLHPVTVPAARVTVIAYPTTSPDGFVTGINTQANRVRPARTSNGASLRVVGHLIRIDATCGTVHVQVFPAISSVPPFRISLQATSSVLAFDPSTFAVLLTGRVMQIGGKVLLLAETIKAVHAPIPQRWADWKPARGYGRAIERSKRRAAASQTPALPFPLRSDDDHLTEQPA